MPEKSIAEHIYEHPIALIFHGDNNRWYSLRPLGEDEYWLESNDGEGTGVKQDLLYSMLDILFKKVM